MVFNPDFWFEKNVLITGHTGFKGSWLSLWLSQLGANVSGFALAPDDPSLFNTAKVNNKVNSHIGDIRNTETLTQIIQQIQPEIIIHMAAQALVRYSYDHPVETYATNIMGTVNVFEAARQTSKVKVILNVTTDKCYDNTGNNLAFQESDPMGGYDPYSSSKACSELISVAYQKSFFNHPPGIALATARAGNVIGGGDWARDRLIPDIIQAFLKNESVSIRHPLAIRPWQFVLEPLHGYLALIEKLWDNNNHFIGAWNFGPRPDEVKTVQSIVQYLSQQWPGSKWSKDAQDHPYEAKYLSLNCEKAKQDLDWKPILSLEQTLNLILDWYKAYQNEKEMQHVTLTQIQSYQEQLLA